jgi:hypothetical protein
VDIAYYSQENINFTAFDESQDLDLILVIERNNEFSETETGNSLASDYSLLNLVSR